MSQPYFNPTISGHDNEQRIIGGALLPFLAGALVTAPFIYGNRPYYRPYYPPYPYQYPYYPPYYGPYPYHRY